MQAEVLNRSVACALWAPRAHQNVNKSVHKEDVGMILVSMFHASLITQRDVSGADPGY